jgi:hypothetical protein
MKCPKGTRMNSPKVITIKSTISLILPTTNLRDIVLLILPRVSVVVLTPRLLVEHPAVMIYILPHALSLRVEKYMMGTITLTPRPLLNMIGTMTIFPARLKELVIGCITISIRPRRLPDKVGSVVALLSSRVKWDQMTPVIIFAHCVAARVLSLRHHPLQVAHVIHPTLFTVDHPEKANIPVPIHL